MSQPLSLQVVIDCTSPHELADWWAETLDWEVEPQDEAFIQSMIDQGFAADEGTTMHNGSLVWASATAIRPAQSTGSGQPRLLFQQVPEPKTVKNRIHFDLRPDDATDLAALRQDLIDRGATQIGQGEQGPHQWVILTDPEGNEFCLHC